MSEKITAFKIKDPQKVFAVDRKVFQMHRSELFLNGKDQEQGYVSVYLLLFNQRGEIWIQKRSESLVVNGGKWCLSVAGHLTWGFNAPEVVILESTEEMGVPMACLREPSFGLGYPKMKPYLASLGIMKPLGTYLDIFPKDCRGTGIIPCVSKKHLFIGVYHGEPNPLDGEVGATKALTLENLHQELRAKPENFTKDLAMVLEKYNTDLEDFVRFLKTNKPA